MPNITGKLDELQAKVKTELAIFLANQGVLLSLRSGLQRLQEAKPTVWATLDATYNTLYNKQTMLEDRAMAWVGAINGVRADIMSNPDIAAALSSGTISPAMFTGDFWAKVTKYTNTALPLINEGLGLSSMLVGQNGDVALLKKSVDQGVILLPSQKTVLINSGLAWAYGALGIGLAYVIATRKKSA